MARQSISLTEPNDTWLKSQIINNEYASKSELVNDLIRQARGAQAKIDWLASKLDRAKNSGVSTNSGSEILAKSKAIYNAEL
jgi:antitoxin ParD1/3/4